MSQHEPRGSLTWYQGSIPPYASLWHTLVRLGALNRLSLSELLTHTVDHVDKRLPRSTLHPLFNKPKSVDIQALAAALGEDSHSLRLSHLGELTPWVHSLFYRHLRFCKTCFSLGYHSSLFSLKLLNACPIHNEPLDDYCPCGNVIGDRLSSANFQQFWHCASHSPHCLGRENCRIPRMPLGLTHALDDIATWLEALSTLVKPLDNSNTYNDAVNPLRLDAAQWCDVFGIQYPQYLSRSTGQSLALNIVKGGPFPKRVSSPANAITHASRYWQEDSPATWTYRAISRHLRRHYTQPNALSVGQFAVPKDCTFVIAKVAHDPRLAAAYVEARWAAHLERHVRERRWPYREPSMESQYQLVGQVMLFDAPDWRTLDSGVRTWLEYHWAAYYMLSVWAHYAGLSSQVPDSTATAQSSSAQSIPKWDWAGKVQADGSVLFACRRQGTFILPTREHTPKCERVRARLVLALQRDRRLEDTCKGPCLTWNQQCGWTVVPALAPLVMRYSRHSLWGPFKHNPKFWLYPVIGGFAARLERCALQVHGQTPAKAISLLRTAYALYERTYPITQG